MAKAGFQDVALVGGVGAGGLAGDEILRFTRRKLEIKNESFAGQIVNVVFEMLDPCHKCGTTVGGRPRGLVGEIRTDVAIGENDFAIVECFFEARLGLETIAGVEQRGEMRVDGFEGPEVAIEELADHFAEPGVVLRKADGIHGVALSDERFFEKAGLGAFAAAIDSFEGDEFSARRHIGRPV